MVHSHSSPTSELTSNYNMNNETVEFDTGKACTTSRARLPSEQASNHVETGRGKPPNGSCEGGAVCNANTTLTAAATKWTRALDSANSLHAYESRLRLWVGTLHATPVRCWQDDGGSCRWEWQHDQDSFFSPPTDPRCEAVSARSMALLRGHAYGLESKVPVLAEGVCVAGFAWVTAAWRSGIAQDVAANVARSILVTLVSVRIGQISLSRACWMLWASR